MKVRFEHKLTSVCTLMLAAIFNLVFASVTTDVTYVVEFSRSDLQFGTSNDYDLVTMKHGSVISELGEPVLPAEHIGIALPAGTEVTQVHAVSRGPRSIPGKFLIMPGQPPVPIGHVHDEIVVQPDTAIYNSSVAYPAELAQLTSQGNIAGQQIAWFIVYPVQYCPAQGSIIFHDRIELTIKCIPAAHDEYCERYFKFTEHQRRLYEDIIKSSVINPNQVMINPEPAPPSLFLTPGEYLHVIITSSTLAPYFEPLVQWHTQKGYRDTVITTDWIYATYAGPGDSLKVRQFIIDANATWGTMYFLIGGEHSIVPFCCRYYYGEYPGQITPSDQYYSDFDDDWAHEVYVGRASVETPTQVVIFINKVLKYEKNPPLTDYPLEIMFIGMDLESQTLGEILKEVLDTYVPNYFNVHKVYDSHGGNHRDSALYYWNQGMNIVNHADHAWEAGMYIGCHNHYWYYWYIDRWDVYFLANNNKPCILTSLGCECNAMDYNDCIAEHWVIYNDNQAGIAFNGNTRHGWGIVGNPLSLSGKLDFLWWYGIFVYNKNNLGKAMMYAKQLFGTFDNLRRHCEWTFNLLGEPAMPIWTDAPQNLIATYDSHVEAPLDTFIVTVTDEDSVTPIEDALVCCWIPNQNPTEMYETAYTDETGQAVVIIEPTMTGDTMLVTITANNYLYHEGRALVLGLISADIEIHPDVLNAKSKGKWTTCYIELPDGYAVEDIDANTVNLIEADGEPFDPPLHREGPIGIGDHDEDSIPDLMVKFDRQELIAQLTQMGKTADIELTVQGELYDGTMFQGYDTIFFMQEAHAGGGQQAQQEIPLTYAVVGCVPNPFESQVTITYAVPVPAHITVAVYDASGRVVKLLERAHLQPGYHAVSWDGINSHGRVVPNGVYFVRFKTDEFTSTEKLVLLK